MADVLILADDQLHRIDAALQLGAVVDVDVAEESPRMLLLFLMGAERMVGHIFLVPLAEVLENLGPYLALLVQEVAAFVQGDEDVEKFLHAAARAAHGGQHRHAEELAQLHIVQGIAAGLQFVVHIEGHHHADVHVYQLGGQVEVALQVGGIDYVNDDIRCLVDDVTAHVDFLGRIGRERIRARQVDDAEVIALEVEEAFLGIDRHAAVIAHMLVRTRGDVEERRLAAIRIAHEGHVDGAALVARQVTHLLLGQADVLLQAFVVAGLHVVLPRLLFADDLNHVGLLPAQGDFIPHHFIFHRVLQRRVEQHFHRLALDEAHFHNALAETSMAHHFDNHAFLTGLQFG